jgi:hypothetical protein
MGLEPTTFCVSRPQRHASSSISGTNAATLQPPLPNETMAPAYLQDFQSG